MKYRTQPKRAQNAHTDDWLMTYADMITLLLCFFVVLLIASVAKKDAEHTAPAKQTTVKVDTQQPPPKLDDQELKLSLDLSPDNLLFRKVEPTDFPVALHPAEDGADRTLAATDPASSDTELPAIVPPVVPVVEAPPPSPANTTDASPTTPPDTAGNPIPPVSSQDDVHVEQKGDRITTLELNSAAFFDSGSAALSVAGKNILQNVAGDLKAEKYKDYQITVEGHTDDTPIKTVQFPSNWELSTARASAVVHFFLEQGIAAQKLRAAGYADTFPKLPNRDANGKAIPSNQAQNRRVIIRLDKIDKAG